MSIFVVPCLLVTIPSICCCRYCRCCRCCFFNKKRVNKVHQVNNNEIRFSESDIEPASDLHNDEFEEGDGINRSARMVAGRSNTENFFDINDDRHNADIEMVDIDGEDNTKSNMLSG